MTDFLLSNFGHALLVEALEPGDTTMVIEASKASRFPEPGVGEAFAIILWDGQEPQEIVYCTENDLSGSLTIVRAQEGTSARAWMAGSQVRHALTAESIDYIIQNGFISGNMADQAEAEAGVEPLKLMSPERTAQFFEARTTTISRDLLLLETIEEIRGALGFATFTASGTGLQDIFAINTNAVFNPIYVKVYVDEVYQTPDLYSIDETSPGQYSITFDTPPPSGVGNIVLVLGVNFAFSVSYPGDNTVDTVTIVDGAVTTDKLDDLSVTTAKLAANAVTNGKLADNAVTSGKIVDNTIAGVKLADNAVDLAGTKVTGVLPTAKMTQSSTTNTGAIETATTLEAQAGSDTTRAVTPAGMKATIELGYRLIGYQVITSTGDYTPTAGTRAIEVEMVGGGAGGGGADNSDADSALGAGGGGAGEGAKFFKSLSGVTTPIACTIGAAGTAGANTGGDGGDGGDTIFGAIATCKGGKGGKGFSSAFFEGYEGGLGGNGGTVPAGGLLIAGQTGDSGSGRYGGGASADAANGGTGGGSILGGGGLGGRSFGSSDAGHAALGYGAGGGGAACSGTTSGAVGGVGKKGVILIKEYI